MRWTKAPAIKVFGKTVLKSKDDPFAIARSRVSFAEGKASPTENLHNRVDTQIS
jgi:hypothetical protein